MTNQEIYDLMERFQRSDLHSLKLCRDDVQLELCRESGRVPAPAPVIPAAAPAERTDAPASPLITAPLVGTFYVAPAPGQPPFASVGQQVKKGETVCLIEAMKMMSEVPAPCDCMIEAVLPQDGELVSFQEPLFRYREI